MLQTQRVDNANASSPHELVLRNCTPGFAGTLCAKCVSGYKMSVTQTCEPCDLSTSVWSPWLLVPLLLAGAYVILRKFFTFRREKRQEKLGAAKRLFTELRKSPGAATTSSQGTPVQLTTQQMVVAATTSNQAAATELTKQQMVAAFAELGLTLPDSVAFDLLDAIDVDHTGRINEHEFETWMDHNVSRLRVRMNTCIALAQLHC